MDNVSTVTTKFSPKLNPLGLLHEVFMNLFKSFSVISFTLLSFAPMHAEFEQNKQAVSSHDQYATQLLQMSKKITQIEQFLKLEHYTAKDIEYFLTNYSQTKELYNRIETTNASPAEKLMFFFLDLCLSKVDSLYTLIIENKNKSDELLNDLISQWVKNNCLKTDTQSSIKQSSS